MTSWTVVLPVKSLAWAKSRLAPRATPSLRIALARAFALDTIAAAKSALSVDRVVVVTGQADFDAQLPCDIEVVQEPAGAGLASAIRLGIARARESELAPVAVLLSDLPSLRPGDLDAALAAAARFPHAFVRDAEGSGSTLATATADEALVPRFGAESAARHERAGFVDLVRVASPPIAARLRHDVDTMQSLEQAFESGVGAWTADVFTRHDFGVAPVNVVASEHD